MIAAGRAVAVLLAAGRSRRFGAGDKLMAPLDGKPLALHAGEMLAEIGFARLIAVCVPGADRPASDLAAIGFEIVLPSAGLGQAASIAAGVASAGEADALLIALADMPLVPADHIRALLAAGGGPPIVATGVDSRAMVPALFARDEWTRLAGLTGDDGARSLLGNAALVPLDRRFVGDIDRPRDLMEARLLGQVADQNRPEGVFGGWGSIEGQGDE